MSDSLSTPLARAGRHWPWIGIALTLVVLATVILAARQHLRRELRRQIAGRDAQILYSLAQQQFAEVTSEITISDESSDQLIAVLETLGLPQLGSMMGTRLFDRDGKFFDAFPEHVTEGTLPDGTLPQLKRLEPVSRFNPKAHLSDVSWLYEGNGSSGNETMPLFEVIVPLHKENARELAGIAQFILDGKSLAAEFARLDRNLLVQSIVAFAGGGGIILLALSLTFRKLQRTNRLLEERTQSLLRANQELTLAAKTSAIGAVSAHLIHGLKNPLFGLQTFMSNRGAAPSEDHDTEWLTAVSTTRRMQTLINDVVRVLREETSAAQYEISLSELAELVTSKLRPLAENCDVAVESSVSADGQLTNREANLITLILENLLQNAVQATSRGGRVSLSVSARADRVICEVRDQGPGLPAELIPTLFTPCTSSKDGGSGIGLAISKQLANHIGATLEMKSSSAAGCVFELSLPKGLFESKGKLASEASF